MSSGTAFLRDAAAGDAVARGESSESSRVTSLQPAPYAGQAGPPDATVVSLEDATVLLPDAGEGTKWAEPILSFVSLNARTAATFDIVRGRLTVVPELQGHAARTVKVSCGRDASNTIVLHDARVSLRHFTVHVRASRGGMVTLDLLDQSSNGTWVNDRRVGKGRCVSLAVGDSIVVLPEAEVGRAASVGYMLLHDSRGATCSRSAAPPREAPRSAPASVPLAPRSAATRAAVVEAAAPPPTPSLLAAIEGAAACTATPRPTSPPEAQEKEKDSRGLELGAGATTPRTLPRELEKDIRCGICADALHRCLTLVPCGHNFCTACLLRWRRRSPLCPECRERVHQAVRNAAVDEVVQAFIDAHPDAARSPRELAAMRVRETEPENAAVLRWLLRDKPSFTRAAVEPHEAPTPMQRRRHAPVQAAYHAAADRRAYLERQAAEQGTPAVQSATCVVS